MAKQKSAFRKKFGLQWQYLLMLLPGMIFVFIFSYIPLYGLVIAFQDYNVGLGFHSEWVGMKNFIFLFNQPTFARTIRNTLFIAIWKLVLGIIVPVTFALLLNEMRSNKLKRFYQTLIYIPNFLSWVIMAGVLLDILSTNGAVNRFLNLIGVDSVNFLGDPDVFPWTVIISDVWKTFGYGTVIYLAALTSIDPGLYESAVLDGASRAQQVFYITIPLLLPTIILMTVLSLGSILNAGFDQIYNMYSPVVWETGDIIDTYVFRLGFQQAQYSVGTAVGLFKSFVSAFLVLLSYVLADKLAGYRIL